VEPSNDGAWLAASQRTGLGFDWQRLPAEGPDLAPHYVCCKQQTPGTVGLRQRIFKEQPNYGGAPIVFNVSAESPSCQQKMTLGH
jgi:hypothetical protein